MKKLFIMLLLWMGGSLSATAQVDLSGVDPEKLLVLDVSYPGGKGRIVINTFEKFAPVHVARLKELARQEFYDGQIFHRVIDGFMAQTGDPEGTGLGGSGQNLQPEFSRLPHLRGTLSMARADEEDSADSQFFIALNRVAYLDNKYTIWGRVVSGMEHVDAIPKGEPPMTPGKIIRMRVAADIANWPALTIPE